MWTMKILVILLPFFGTISFTYAQRCERIKIGNEYYRRHLVATIDGYPTEIEVDPRTDNIFFMLIKKNFTKGLHLIKHGSLGVKELPVSDDINGQCVGIDTAHNVIYIGTNQGILTYDYSRSEMPSDRPIGDDDVRRIIYDRFDLQLYIITGATHDVYRFDHNSSVIKRFEKVPKAYNLILDAKGNVYYEYIDGKMYFLSVDYFEPIMFRGFNRDLKYILKVNNFDDAVVAIKGSIYKLDTNNILPVKIGNLGYKITGMAFDNKNNIIIGTKGKIYKYKPLNSNDPCPPDDYFMSNI